MPASKYVAPDFTVDNAATYKGKIDAGFNAMAAVAAAFQPYANETPAMNIKLAAGALLVNALLPSAVAQAVQTTGTITAPVGNPRIDRVVIDAITAAVSVITGTPAASPAAPALTAGKIPCAQILLQTSSTSITNAMITDERPLFILNQSVLTKADKSGAYTVTGSDRGQLTNFTGSSPATFSFTACATLGSGWWSYLENSGTDYATLDPNGSETIDTLTTFRMYPGERRVVWTDGSNLFSRVLKGFHATFTASGTFIEPPGYAYYDALPIGGGGAGAGSNGAGQGCGGGGGGGGFMRRTKAGAPGTSISITVGAGGTGASQVSGSVGAVGGNTTATINGYLIKGGGGAGGTNTAAGSASSYGGGGGGGGGGAVGGASVPAVSGGGGGGAGAGAFAGGAGAFAGASGASLVGGKGGDAFYDGGGGGGGGGCDVSSASNAGGNGGAALWGGGGGGGGTNLGTGGTGGTSVFGGAGGNGNVTSGSAPGGGGGGASGSGGSVAGGSGAAGAFNIWGVVA